MTEFCCDDKHVAEFAVVRSTNNYAGDVRVPLNVDYNPCNNLSTEVNLSKDF